jgi:hypothetical protein
MTCRSYHDSNFKIVFVMGVLAWSTLLSTCQGNPSGPAQISGTSLPAIPSLFLESSLEIKTEISTDPTIIRSRYVKLNLNLLGESEVGDEISLNLFDDVVYTAILEEKEPTLTNGYTWTGYLDGIQHSQVILIIGGDQVAGNITLPGAFYEIRYTGDGMHIVYQVDQSAFPPEAEPIEPGG